MFILDVKLSDFANSLTPAGRLRKSVGNTFIKEGMKCVSSQRFDNFF